jgi:hypothetical protein
LTRCLEVVEATNWVLHTSAGPVEAAAEAAVEAVFVYSMKILCIGRH